MCQAHLLTHRSPSLTSSYSDLPALPPHTQVPQLYLLTLRYSCLTSSHSDPLALPPHTQIPSLTSSHSYSPALLPHTQNPLPYLLTLRPPALLACTQIPQPYLLSLRSLNLTSSHTKLAVSSPHSQRSNKEFTYNLHHFSRMPYSKFQKQKITWNIIYLMIEFLFFYFFYMFICFSNEPYTVRYLGHQN